MVCLHCLAAVCLRHNGQSVVVSAGPAWFDAAAQPGVARHGADTQPQGTNAAGHHSGISDVQESGLGDDKVIVNVTDAATRHDSGLLGGSEALGEAEVDPLAGHSWSQLLIGPHGQGRQQTRGDLPGGHPTRGREAKGPGRYICWEVVQAVWQADSHIVVCE